MGRKKSSDYWLGIPHIRTRLEVLDSPAWRVLDYSARALYHDLRAKLRGNNNGNINATLSEMKHKGWRSSATLSRALRQLERLGFIAKTRQGGIASYSKLCTLYRFTDLPSLEWPKLDIPAYPETFDYRAFKTVKEAEAHLRQPINEGSESEPNSFRNETYVASESEQVKGSKLQNLNKRKCA